MRHTITHEERLIEVRKMYFDLIPKFPTPRQRAEVLRQIAEEYHVGENTVGEWMRELFGKK